MSFGSLDSPRPDPAGRNKVPFRIALLGDFSGRAAQGLVETGRALADRRPIRLDVDTLEKVIAGFSTRLVLPIGKHGAGIGVDLSSLDDLHPDELFEKVEMFEALVSLKRRLASGATAKGAAAQLREWGRAHGRKVAPPSRKSAGNTMPADRTLNDFARLVGAAPREKAKPSALDDLMARIVGPYVTAVPDADTAAMQHAVEAALSGAMRLLLHHPEFQSVEAQWRMLDLITRSVETDGKLDIVLYDISAEELAADLSAAEDLTHSGFCELLVEGTPDGRGPFSAVCGFYTFEETPPHAALLGRIAKVAAHVNAPFFAAITPTFLDVAKEDRHPLVAEAWDALRALPEAGHVALASPQFLLRRPYGAKSEPVYEFEFEEFTAQEGLSGMLWANPVALVVILLAQSFRKNGAALGLGSVMSLGGMPFHFVRDRYGDQVALPCTERNLSQLKTATAMARGLMPVVSVKGRDEVRLASFQSLAGTTVLGGWSDVVPPAPKPKAQATTGGEAVALAQDNGTDDGLSALLAGFDTATDGGDGSEADAAEIVGDAEPDAEAMDDELAALLASL